MINDILRTAAYFIVLVLLQVLVLDNIHYLRLATPFVYLYCLLKMPVGISRSQMLIFSFFVGIVIDMFSNTSGMHAFACTLAGFLREPLIRLIQGKDLPIGIYPSFYTFGYKGFFRYVLLFVAIHHCALFLVEALSFFDSFYLLLRIAASVVTTVLLIMIFELFNFESQKIGE